MRRGRRPACYGCARISDCSPICGRRWCIRRWPELRACKPELIEGLDIMIVRELTGGVYFGEPKTITDLGNGQKRAIDTQVYDTYEIERIARVAFDLARKRRNKVTSMEKRNVMKSGVLWNEVVTQVHAREYKDVTLEHQLADSGAMQPGEVAEAVRRHRHRQSVRRHAVRHRGDADGLARHAAVSLARRDRCQDQKAPLAVRAGARFGAGHRRQGARQSDRDAGLVRNGAYVIRSTWARLPTSSMRRSPPCWRKACAPPTSSRKA